MGALRIILALTLLAGSAAAQTRTGKEAARELFATATQHYNLSEFAEALAAFKDAYRAYPDATFLFNIAQCQRQLGDKNGALLSYKAYLRERPEAPNRAEVSALVANLERAIKEDQSSLNRPPGGVIPPTASETKPREAATSPPPAEPTTPTTPPPPATTTTMTPPPPATTTATSASTTAQPELVAVKNGPQRSRTPVYKKWWLWTTIGVVVVAGAAIGLGVALAPAKQSFPQASTSDGTVAF